MVYFLSSVESLRLHGIPLCTTSVQTTGKRAVSVNTSGPRGRRSRWRQTKPTAVGEAPGVIRHTAVSEVDDINDDREDSGSGYINAVPKSSRDNL